MSTARPGAAPGGAAGGIALVLTAAVLWSSSGLFIKLLTLDGFALTGLRSGIAVLVLLPFVRLRALRVDGIALLLMVAFAATQLCFVFSTRWTTAANAIALQSTAPAWVYLLGCLTTRRVDVPLLGPLVLIGAGIAAMLAEPAQGTSQQGNLLALGGGFAFAVSLICLRRVNQPAVGAVMVAHVGSLLTALVLAPGAFHPGAVPGWEWAVLVYLGAIQIGLSMILFTAGARRITVHQASVLTLLEPLLNPVWVYLVLGEAPSGYGFVGYGLILAGIVADFWVRLGRPVVSAGGTG